MSNARNLAMLKPNSAGKLPDSNLQNPAVPQKMPDFSAGVSMGTNTWNQAPSDGLVTVVCAGPYMNNTLVYAGKTISSYSQIGQMGDDINNNTKYASFSFPIKAGSWFYVSQGFESTLITFFPNV